MADITKCPGEGCGLKEVCYRYTAPEDEYWQAYLLETPTDDPCPYYWQNEIWEDGADGQTE
jgi:hypothetical protein